MFYLFLLAAWWAGFGSDTVEDIRWYAYRWTNRHLIRTLHGGFDK
jgi:hypothetical protein